jgi:hypothetical protein
METDFYSIRPSRVPAPKNVEKHRPTEVKSGSVVATLISERNDWRRIDQGQYRPMQEWNPKSFERFINNRKEKPSEETEEHSPKIEKWLKLADQMLGTDEDPEAA